MFEGLFQPMHLLVISSSRCWCLAQEMPELGKGWARHSRTERRYEG